MVVPELDPAQRQAALDKAIDARNKRAELKQMLKSREVGLAEVLDRAQRDERLAKMRVADLLAAMPAFGKVKTNRLMDDLGIARSRRVQGLGPRQREGLLAHFDGR